MILKEETQLEESCTSQRNIISSVISGYFAGIFDSGEKKGRHYKCIGLVNIVQKISRLYKRI